MDDAVVRRYAENMKAGNVFPPVEVANVGGMFYLTDGWHRVTASRQSGLTSITAVVREMSRKDALWEAAVANTKHGKPLSNREYRNVFRAFVKAGKYRNRFGWQSLRAIAGILGKSHTTICTWMEKDFPRIYREYGRPPEKRSEDVEPPNPQEIAHMSNLNNGITDLDCVRNVARSLDLVRRGILISKMEDVLKELLELPYQPHLEEPEDF